MKLPPLPEPDGYMRHTPVWAEDEMRAYGEACARAAFERAIELCDSVWKGYDREFQGEAQETVGDCIALIEKEMQ